MGAVSAANLRCGQCAVEHRVLVPEVWRPGQKFRCPRCGTKTPDVVIEALRSLANLARRELRRGKPGRN